jgi:hypothetical protein
LSSVPHLAGTSQDKEQAEWLKQNFLDFGLDDAVLVPYNVLLSYPNKTQANKVSLLNDTGIWLETQAKQKPLYGEEEASDLIVSNFNAYSAPGIVQVKMNVLKIKYKSIQYFNSSAMNEERQSRLHLLWPYGRF